MWQRLGIRRLLDVPCGDGAWIRDINVSLDAYIGADIVPDLVSGLAADARPHETFVRLDAVSDPLPPADAVLCRDLMVHLPYRQAMSVLDNIRKSGARYLIATTFQGRVNRDIHPGGWRPLDLERAPFSLGSPVELIDEGCTEGGGQWRDKALGVWDLHRTD